MVILSSYLIMSGEIFRGYRMGIFNWFNSSSALNEEDQIVVKYLKSKGVSKTELPITVGDIKRGIAVDAQGYQNEVVLFLRKNKRDR